jgi:hypothetical protein
MKLVSFPALHTGRLYPQETLAPLGIEVATFRLLVLITFIFNADVRQTQA